MNCSSAVLATLSFITFSIVSMPAGGPIIETTSPVLESGCTVGGKLATETSVGTHHNCVDNF